ncbi:MAG: sulfotransferase domain-containing protein [Cyclobacteriaceae bacterium]
MKNFKIDFLVIGVQKSGTSWLYNCLKEHPEIGVPLKKREVEYIGGPLYREHGGMDWFRGLFNHLPDSNNLKYGDVSVEYIFDAGSAYEVKKYFPNCKIILILRNPIDRFLSSLEWNKRRGQLKDENDHGVLEALKKGNSEVIENISNRGFYAEQVSFYYESFPKENIFIADFEKIKESPSEVIKSIFSFLSVDPDFLPKSISSKPKKNSNNRLLIKLENRLSRNKYTEKVLDHLHQLLPTRKRKTSSHLTEYLKELYEPHNEILKKFFLDKKQDKLVEMVESWKNEY